MSAADVIVRFFHDVDRRNWPALRSALTDTVGIDYTSLSGGSPERLSADELLARWAGLLPGFDVTQHFLGPIVPAAHDSSEDTVHECNVRGYHRLSVPERDNDVWMVAGSYAIGTRQTESGPQISSITLHVSYQEGDPSLAELATARVRSPRAAPAS